MPKDKNREPKLRAVLDTNVLISAFHKPEGTLAPLWLLARERKYVLLTSPAIVTETARILRNRFHWQEGPLHLRIVKLSDSFCYIKVVNRLIYPLWKSIIPSWK
jgi:predicted nucleic acid-binding protein